MFDYFKNKWFLSKVQAELKAQYNDQYFVNTVCQHSEILEHIITIKEQSYYRKESIAPFLTVCFILGEVAFTERFAQEIRDIATSLLVQRLLKVERDPQFRLKHIFIFGDLEQKMKEHLENNNGVYDHV